MAGLASWTDYLPETRTQQDEVLGAALAKARADAAELERAGVPPKDVANRLGDGLLAFANDVGAG